MQELEIDVTFDSKKSIFIGKRMEPLSPSKLFCESSFCEIQYALKTITCDYRICVHVR